MHIRLLNLLIKCKGTGWSRSAASWERRKLITSSSRVQWYSSARNTICSRVGSFLPFSHILIVFLDAESPACSKISERFSCERWFWRRNRFSCFPVAIGSTHISQVVALLMVSIDIVLPPQRWKRITAIRWAWCPFYNCWKRTILSNHLQYNTILL